MVCVQKPDARREHLVWEVCAVHTQPYCSLWEGGRSRHSGHAPASIRPLSPEASAFPSSATIAPYTCVCMCTHAHIHTFICPTHAGPGRGADLGSGPHQTAWDSILGKQVLGLKAATTCRVQAGPAGWCGWHQLSSGARVSPSAHLVVMPSCHVCSAGL